MLQLRLQRKLRCKPRRKLQRKLQRKLRGSLNLLTLLIRPRENVLRELRLIRICRICSASQFAIRLRTPTLQNRLARQAQRVHLARLNRRAQRVLRAQLNRRAQRVLRVRLNRRAQRVLRVRLNRQAVLRHRNPRAPRDLNAIATRAAACLRLRKSLSRMKTVIARMIPIRRVARTASATAALTRGLSVTQRHRLRQRRYHRALHHLRQMMN